MNIYQILEPVTNKIKSMLSKAIVSLVNDSTNMQLIQIEILKDEVKDNVERVQDYGLTSFPRKGAEALIGFINGNKDHGVAIKVDDSRVRPKNLQEGEVVLYHESGSKIYMKSNGDINIESAGKVTLDGDSIELGSGVLEKLIKGDSFLTFFNSHVHVVPGIGPSAVPTAPMTSAQLSSKGMVE